jgi:hypothetical protein
MQNPSSLAHERSVNGVETVRKYSFGQQTADRPWPTGYIGGVNAAVSSLLAFSILLLFSAPAHADATVEALIKKAETILQGDTSAAVFEMEIKTKRYQRSYKVVSWEDRRTSDKSLIKILGPASWRGFGTLKLGSQLKIYDPKTNHVQRVGASMLGDSWMGSHFSNDDLVRETRLYRDYDLKLDKKWSDDGTRYRVALLPKPTAPIAWGRITYEVHERGKDVLPVSVKYFRKRTDSKAARTLTFSEVASMAGRNVPTTMTMRIARKPGEFTRIRYKKLRLNIKIPASKFSEQALRR